MPVFSRSLFWNWLVNEPGVRVDLLFARFSEVLENIDLAADTLSRIESLQSCTKRLWSLFVSTEYRALGKWLRRAWTWM